MAARKSSRKKHISPVEIRSKFGVRIAHHRHTGRRVPIRYTSYALLFFLLALTGASLLFAGNSVRADITSSGSINVSGVIPGPPPSIPAVITDPANGTHFTDPIITVKGTCQADMLIEIYRFAIFAGSTICTTSGTFQVVITLIPGQNDLKARTSDSQGQYGPDSEIVTVFYDVPVPIPSQPELTQPQPRTPDRPSAPPPLLLYTRPVYRGINRNRTVTIEYEVDGGTPAYAVSFNWDDGSPGEPKSLPKEGDYTIDHKYTKAGQYSLTISAADQAGGRAVLQTIIVVNQSATGEAAALATCATAPESVECFITSRIADIIEKLWPAFMVACLMTFSFWLGERVVYTHMRSHPSTKPKHS